MPQESYAYAVARTRVKERRLLNYERISRMMDASNPEEAFRLLLETGYGQNSTANVFDYEKLIDYEMKSAVDYIKEVTPDEAFTGLFLMKYDCHNIKVLIKESYVKSGDAPLVSYGNISISKLITHYEQGTLPDAFEQVVDSVQSEMKEYLDAQKMDNLMDQAMYNIIFKNLNKKCKFALEYFRAQVDIKNLITALRARNMGLDEQTLSESLISHGIMEYSTFINVLNSHQDNLITLLKDMPYKQIIEPGISDYVKNGRVTLLERLLDNYLLNLVKEHKMEPYSIEPIIGYLLAKEREASAVRLAMTVKLNVLDSEIAQERVRELYV